MISEIEEEQITKKPSFEPPQYGIMGRSGNIHMGSYLHTLSVKYFNDLLGSQNSERDMVKLHSSIP